MVLRLAAITLAALWAVGALATLLLIASTVLRDQRERRHDTHDVVLLAPDPGSVAWCEDLYEQEAA